MHRFDLARLDSMIIVLDASARLGPSYPWYHGQVSLDPWDVVKVIFTPHDSVLIVLDAFATLGPSYYWCHGHVLSDPWKF